MVMGFEEKQKSSAKFSILDVAGPVSASQRVLTLNVSKIMKTTFLMMFLL